jgi:hypothetical protein
VHGGEKIPFSQIVQELSMTGGTLRHRDDDQFVGMLGGETKFIIAPRGRARKPKSVSL